MEKISVVVSCYNEEESIPLFYNEIKKVMSIMKECVIFQKFWERSSDVCGIKLCFWRVCHNHGCGFTRSAKSVA